MVRGVSGKACGAGACMAFSFGAWVDADSAGAWFDADSAGACMAFSFGAWVDADGAGAWCGVFVRRMV